MNKKRQSLRLLLATLLAAVLFPVQGCRHIDLYDPTSGLYIALNLVVPDEGKAISPKAPEVVRALLYDHESHDLVHEEYISAEGGFINVDVGTYDIILYGYGTESTIVKWEGSLGKIYAYTNRVGQTLVMTRGEGSEIDNLQYPLIHEPDHLFVATAEDIFVPARDGMSQTVRLDLEFKSIIETYTLEAPNVHGGENIRSMSCYVTGQLAGRYLWDLRYPQEICAMTIPVTYYGGSQGIGNITGAFNTFGKFPHVTSVIYLNIMVQNTSGGLFQFIYDVTEQFEDPDNKEKKLIVDSDINIPSTTDSGFVPSVEDWNAVVTVIPL